MSSNLAPLPSHLVETVRQQARAEGVTPEVFLEACVEERLDRSGAAEQPALRERQPSSTEEYLFPFSFIRKLSHAVRTDVTSILGFTEILEQEVALSQQELVDIIRRGGERLLRTIDSVMYLARLEDGSVTLDPEPVAVGEELRKLTDSCRQQARAKEVTIELEAPPSEYYLTVDRGAFRRIVRELLDNALKFTEQGHVTVDLRPEGDRARLTVVDTGTGIAPADGEAIFEPFYQRPGGEDDSVVGSGLGLTLTRKLIEQIGGTITWTSTPGEGTAFSVTFTEALEDSSPGQKKGERCHQWGFDQLPADQCVLIVEDDPATGQLLQEMLPSSFTIDLLKDVSSALEQAHAYHYDIVLMDINLKDRIDGTELMSQMRRIDGYEDALFIAVTAYEKALDGEPFSEKGFDGYVSKPFTKETLYKNLIQV